MCFVSPMICKSSPSGMFYQIQSKENTMTQTNETAVVSADLIIRLTRHAETAEQLIELKRIFGSEVKVETKSVSLPVNPKEAVIMFDELTEGASVVEAVLPINLLEAVLKFSAFSKRGGRVIRAKMNRIPTGKLNERGEDEFEFVFTSYEEVKHVTIVTVPL